MSLPFTVALALVLANERGPGAPLSVDDYQARLGDAAVRRIARATECRVDAAVEAMTTDEVVPARVTVRLRDGSERVAAVGRPLGAPGRPLAFDDAIRLFRAAGAGFLEAGSLDAVVDAVDRFAVSGSPREVAASFSAVAAGSAR
jgi:2-methylcitrate dehydratase PrpD